MQTKILSSTGGLPQPGGGEKLPQSQTGFCSLRKEPRTKKAGLLGRREWTFY